MRRVYAIGALCLLALVCCGVCADLRTSEVGSEKPMQYRATSPKRYSPSPFAQVANMAYRRASRSAPSTEAPEAPYAAGECPAPRDDLCIKYNHNCAGCLATPGCGYCNDFRQCLPSAGDNPDVLGCECEVWMNEPKQCTEEVCSVVEGCSECSKKPYCVWCPHEQLCMPGGFFGLAPNKQVTCKDWRWLRCEGVTGTTILIISGSTFAGVLVLFFTTCVVYHKCYSPVKHSAHMSDELEESNLLEEERNLLSGHHEDEHNERMAEAKRSIVKVDPALDLKDNSAALKEPRSPITRIMTGPEDVPVTLEEDDYSQSETDDDMEFGTPQVISDLKARLNASSSANTTPEFGVGKVSLSKKAQQHISFKTDVTTSPSTVGGTSGNSSSAIHDPILTGTITTKPNRSLLHPSSSKPTPVPSVIHPGLPAPDIPNTPEPSVFVDAATMQQDEASSTAGFDGFEAPMRTATPSETEFNPRSPDPSSAGASPASSTRLPNSSSPSTPMRDFIEK